MVNTEYLHNHKAVKNHYEKNYLIDKKLGFQVIENGMILPHKDRVFNGQWTWGKGGIVNSKGEFIKGTHMNASLDELVPIYTPPPESIQHSSETVIYLTIFANVWGHILTDNIRRLWFLNNEALRNEFKDCPIVYVPWNMNKGLYYTIDKMSDTCRLLEILGVDFDRLRPITQPTQFDKIILFDEAWNYGANYVTKEYREMMDRVRNFGLKNRTPTSSKKLYFFYGKYQVGEERMAEYFKSKGYEIITHEKRSASFDEELNLLINAESFASPLGSVAQNSVFLRDGTEAIFIPRSYNAFNLFQIMINQVSSLNANYIDSTMSIFNIGHDSFCFIISEQLKRFFGDKFDGYEEGDFKAFLDYVNSPYVRKDRPVNPSELNGYGAIFQDFMTQLKQHPDLIASYDMPSDWKTFRPVLNYWVGVPVKGWWRDGWRAENQPSNPLDQKLEVWGMIVRYSAHKIYYSVYYNEEEGWSQEVASPETTGTVGKPIYGMRARFDEAGAKEFDILYRMHKFDGTWTPWAKNGAALYSHGQKLNTIQIKLEPIKTRPDEENIKDLDFQTFLLKDDEIYVQSQRQNLIQKDLI